MSAVQNQPAKTAKTAKPLSVTARKAIVAKVAGNATAKARAGLKLIDFRAPTARERAIAETLVPRARRALARGAAQAA